MAGGVFRLPVAPLLDHFAATYTGISNAQLMNDPDARVAAVLRTMRELGPWDMTFLADTANAAILKRGIPRCYGSGRLST